MESHTKCPNCGRSLTESELYCYFCEMDLSEFEKKSREMNFPGNSRIKKFLSGKKHPDKKRE